MNLGKLAEHSRYLGHTEPDGTIVLEPAEVISVTEKKLLSDSKLISDIVDSRAHPEHLVARDRSSPRGQPSTAAILFAPAVDKFLTELGATSTEGGPLGPINSALDLLESEPLDDRCRRRKFPNTGCWAISLEVDGTEWLVLWEADAKGTIIVRAIVPSP